MKEKNYEELLDILIGMLLVLHVAQIPPNDAFMEEVIRECDEHGYEIPGGLE